MPALTHFVSGITRDFIFVSATLVVFIELIALCGEVMLLRLNVHVNTFVVAVNQRSCCLVCCQYL